MFLVLICTIVFVYPFVSIDLFVVWFSGFCFEGKSIMSFKFVNKGASIYNLLTSLKCIIVLGRLLCFLAHKTREMQSK